MAAPRAFVLTMALAILASEQAGATGFASYFARISAVGVVQKSLGVANGAKTAVGIYDVTFTRAVSACGWVASVNQSLPGYATVKVGATPMILTVSTYASNGVKADRPFTLMVQCGP